VAGDLERMKLLTGIDRSALLVYCELVAEFESAIAILQQKGRTVRTPNGVLMSRPEVSQAHRSAELIRSFASEFGLTPSARTRLGNFGDLDPEEDSAGILS
jgi:P27 family predicted phage terminase small subunit